MKKVTKNTGPQLKDYKSNTYMDGDMEIRFAIGPEETKQLDTQKLAENFLVKDLMTADALKLVYSHYDRVIIGGANPVNKTLTLPNHPELRAEYFLERRELGIINVGGTGTVTADGKKYKVEQLSCLYLGKGTKNVSFASASKKNPALFYLLSSPAHASYPVTLFTKEQASPVELGAPETANKRTVYKYIHLDGIKSCQLVMGLTVMAPGSVWNSIPPHTHTRRMEVYFYFGLPAEQASPVELGAPETANKRTVYKYIHLDGIKSCQLVMGLTVMAPGSVWNSIPPHTHTRRMEVYFYFGLPAEHRIMHFMGNPKETRHIVMANNEAVISAPWSTHYGCGTTNYGFIWGMAGENLVYTDMDPAPVASLV